MKLWKFFMVIVFVGLLIGAIICLVGCDAWTPITLTNDQEIAKAKQCTDAGLDWQRIQWGDGTTKDVVCVKKDGK